MMCVMHDVRHPRWKGCSTRASSILAPLCSDGGRSMRGRIPVCADADARTIFHLGAVLDGRYYGFW